jgi:murein DD-endopeptidase MepM/ murein hydrolase activator NlpD
MPGLFAVCDQAVTTDLPCGRKGCAGKTPQRGNEEAAMADQDDATPELNLSDEDAQRLLDAPDGDSPDERKPDTQSEDKTDWKAEAEKWKSLSRKNEKSANERAAALKKYEDANKTEAERLQEALSQHQSRAEKAEFALKRREIAEQRAPEHATPAQIRAVAKRLAGDNDEALEKDADELFELLAPAPSTPKTTSKPQERLRGGSDPDEPVEESDPRKLAAMLPRRQ